MAAKQTSGWAYLLAGIVIGLFISFVFYLKDKKPEELRDRVGVTATPNNTNAPKPKFDFYNILPELEVVVPSLEVLADKAQTKSAEVKRPTDSPTLESGEKFILQVGSFQSMEEADRLKASLALMGMDVSIQKISVDSKTWHRVRIGPYGNPQSLNAARQRLKANSINAITLKVNG